MLHLVTGGSGSGKSEFAEGLAVKCFAEHSLQNTGRLLYIATMYPYDEECLARIDKHRLMRKDKGFITVECYHHLSSVTVDRGDVILLECMSNLLANEMYQKKGQITARGKQADRQLEERILSPVLGWAEKAADVVLVTNEVFSDGVEYDEETKEYLRLLGRSNMLLAREADVVTEVVCSIPVYHKGNEV